MQVAQDAQPSMTHPGGGGRRKRSFDTIPDSEENWREEVREEVLENQVTRSF